MKRKRLITLLMFFCILAGNAWGKRVYFTYTTVDLSTSSMSTTTAPDNSESCYMYQQDIYWLWTEASDPINLGKVEFSTGNYTNVQDCGDFEWTVKVDGNIDIVCYNKKIDNHYNNDIYFLNTDDPGTAYNATKFGSHIYFKNPSNGEPFKGTIIVTATNKNFEGDPYSCSYTIRVNMDTKSTKWDFYSQHLNPVSSSNWNEVIINGDDKLNGYNAAITSSDDPQYIITETDGLRFVAAANQFGYKDPAPSGTTAIDERYVGLYQGGTLIIPKTTWDSHSDHKTRIRIKMGRFGGTGIRLTIGNGKDALDTPISGTGTYEIGGSMWWGTKGDNHQRGEYHFIVNNKEEDFTLKVESGAGAWLKLYSIEVYESDELITENSVLGDKYQLLNTGGTIGAPGTTGNYYLHYRGKAEGTKIKVDDISTSGNITTNDTKKGFDNLEASSSEELGSPKHQYTSKVGDFGTFGITIGCYTHGVAVNDVTYKYCTDYASRRQSVGYMENKSYPYTWDFKDIWNYKFIGDRMSADYHGEGWYQQNGGLHLWAATDGMDEFGLRLALDAGHDVMYCGGSQLWYGHTIIPEAAGLAFTPVNYDNAYDYSLSLSADGLTFAQENRDWWGWRVTIPSVPAKGAVYVRAKNIGSNDMRHVKFWITNEGVAVNNKTTGETDFWGSNYSSTANHNRVLVEGSSDEYIYAIYNNDETNAKDITLFFNEVEVKKIAVSTDKKTFNALGWTTESRDHDIDPSLTAEMNGRNITTYLVTGVNYDKKVVTMTPINDYLMHKATDDGQEYACILKNSTESTLNIVNGGFYLFVPDMHDEQGETSTSGYKLKNYYTAGTSIMKSKLNPAYPAGYQGSSQVGTPIPYQSEGYTNFAFTYQYYALDGSGNTDGDVIEGLQGFYRIARNGGWSYGNQGYLPLETSQIDSDTMGGRRGFELSFDEDEGGEVTAIENIETSKSEAVAETAIYYSLSGQKLSGKPAKGGIYICNGKKIAIK